MIAFLVYLMLFLAACAAHLEEVPPVVHHPSEATAPIPPPPSEHAQKLEVPRPQEKPKLPPDARVQDDVNKLWQHTIDYQHQLRARIKQNEQDGLGERK
jgi:hypothetical protein